MENRFICIECSDITFTRNSSLRRHYKIKHPTVQLPLTLKRTGDTRFICEECNSKFSFHTNLVRHVRSFHSAQTSHLQDKDFKILLLKKEFKCAKCNAQYSNDRYLKSHERLKHSESVPQVQKKYKCMECHTEFTTIRHLKRHTNLKHNYSVVKKLTAISCSLCSTSFTKKDNLLKHWELEHGINVDTEELNFDDEHKFLVWKNNIETSTKSKFVRNNCKFKSKYGEIMYFQCNRSGYFTSRSKGLRHLKTQGTCKINNYCPAGMKVKVFDNGQHEIKFTKTHIGHEHDLGHINLTQKQRETLATKIALKTPFDAILHDVRESIETNIQFERIHLLTRKDLHNIKQSLNESEDNLIKFEKESN